MNWHELRECLRHLRKQRQSIKRHKSYLHVIVRTRSCYAMSVFYLAHAIPGWNQIVKHCIECEYLRIYNCVLLVASRCCGFCCKYKQLSKSRLPILAGHLMHRVCYQCAPHKTSRNSFVPKNRARTALLALNSTAILSYDPSDASMDH